MLRCAWLLPSKPHTAVLVRVAPTAGFKPETFGLKAEIFIAFEKQTASVAADSRSAFFFFEVQMDLAHLLSGLRIPSPRALRWLLIHDFSKNHSIKTGLATLLGEMGRRPGTVLLGTVLSHHLLPARCPAALPALSEAPGDEKGGCAEARSSVGLQ